MTDVARLTLAQAVDRLPKVELHCHIEGTMRADDARGAGHA